MKKRVLFLCTGNSARSQMAEGILRDMAGDRYELFSAGTHPKGLHPKTIEVMDELGINVRGHRSKDLDQFIGLPFDFVITVCDRARQNCPILPGSTSIHWGFDDPAEAAPERQTETFRRVREEIKQRIRLFVAANRG
jgi:arsenate reductase